MKSRQINFYMSAADQAELLRHFLPLGEYAVINSIAQGLRPKLLETAEIRQMGVERLQVFLARARDLPTIALKEVKNMSYSMVDVDRSPVVEFWRCFQTGCRLGRGRLYFVSAYYDQKELVGKDPSFIEWGNSVTKIAQRVLKKDPVSLIYFGAEALRLKEAGIELGD